MKWIKLFEDFKQNNEAGDLLKQEDIHVFLIGESLMKGAFS